jgi:DNA-binding winged helix-turn-helix (wHTH) protein
VATLAEEQPKGIVLATEPPFQLGGLCVAPALRQVEWGGERRILEPRVMQVLVALRGGQIVGRDELIARCWDGRVVGENAIQRVISLLRQLAAETGAFRIETITKVGYRIEPAPGSAAVQVSPQLAARPALVNRRSMLAGAGAVLALGAGASWLALPSPARREAERLHADGLAMLQRGGVGGIRQAIDTFEQATRADPGFALAWGDLAYARFELTSYLAEPDHEALAAKVREAARRALAIDPANRQAHLALVAIRPNFRNWLDVRREVGAALERMPDEPMLHERTGILHMDTGRVRAAVAEFGWLVRREPLLPGHHIQLARALWYAGDTRRADAMLYQAFRNWPIEQDVWLSRFAFLLQTDRAQGALELIQGNGAVGLGGLSPLPADVGLATARALADAQPASREAAIRAILDARQRGRMGSFIAIPFLVLLGAIEPAWQAIYTYYLGKRDPQSGERSPLPAIAWRRTDILFAPVTAPLRRDARFQKLIAALHLDDYWRKTGTRPDIAFG